MRLAQAIPFCLRAMRSQRPGEFVQTPVGPVLKQIVHRVDAMEKEEGLEHLHDLSEIEVLLKYLQYRYEAYKNPKPAPEQNTDEIALLSRAMSRYIKTGDLTEIVPMGRFTSQEERQVWSRFTMVEVTKVAGRTVRAVKLSNAKDYPHQVCAPGISCSVGKYVLLDDGTSSSLILAAIPLGPDADDLSKTFNRLFRG